MHYIALLCLSPHDSCCPVEPAVVDGRRSAEQSRYTSIGIPALRISSVVALIALENLRSPKKLSLKKSTRNTIFPQ